MLCMWVQRMLNHASFKRRPGLGARLFICAHPTASHKIHNMLRALSDFDAHVIMGHDRYTRLALLPLQ